MNGRQLATIFIAVTIAAVFLTPLNTVTTGSTGVQTVNNTTVTADVGNYSSLPKYDVQSGTEEVVWYNSTSGSNETLVEGTDYEFDNENARIRPLSGGSVSDGDTLYVSYDYQATSGTVATIGRLVPLFVALLILVTLTQKIDM